MTDFLGFLQISTAADSRETAEFLASGVVGARLAAGAQIVGPVVSVLPDPEKPEQGEQWQVLFKTTVERYADVEAHLLAHHPRPTPEITAVPIVAGSADYLNWIRRTTAG